MSRTSDKRRVVSAVLLAAGCCMAAGQGWAQTPAPVTIGFITTLSTPSGYVGEDERDGFLLAIKEEGGTLGGVPVKLDIQDDALKPANAKQAADRMIQSGVRLFTGVNFSNVLAAVLPGVLEAGGFYVSLNPGPSTFAGEKCNPNYFVVSFQNDAAHEAAGLSANKLGYKNVVLLASNYQAGRDALEGFKRTYKGKVAAEIYTKLDQTDFSVEIARVRSLHPDAIYQFHPGGVGINFAKQYANSGLSKTIPMLVPSFSMDSRMVAATGSAAEGVYASAMWTTEFDNQASRNFVANFKKTYSRSPTQYAQQAYETALLIASALREVKGDLTRTDDFRQALRAAKFTSLRGNFSFGPNQHPIQDYYLTRFERGSNGELVQKIVDKVATHYGDAYASQCKMK